MRYLTELIVALSVCIGVLAVLNHRPYPRCTLTLTGHSASLEGDCTSLAPETIKAMGDYLTGLRF